MVTGGAIDHVSITLSSSRLYIDLPSLGTGAMAHVLSMSRAHGMRVAGVVAEGGDVVGAAV